jgi:hypothetical protein
MSDSDLVLLVRTHVSGLAVYGQLPWVVNDDLLLVCASSNVNAGIGLGGAKSA